MRYELLAVSTLCGAVAGCIIFASHPQPSQNVNTLSYGALASLNSSIHDPHYVDPSIEPTLEFILTESGWGLLKEKGITAEHALRYDRFSGHEIYDMISAGISPEVANAYPEAFDPWCDLYNNEAGRYVSDITTLHNSGISASQAGELLYSGLSRQDILQQYCDQKSAF